MYVCMYARNSTFYNHINLKRGCISCHHWIWYLKCPRCSHIAMGQPRITSHVLDAPDALLSISLKSQANVTTINNFIVLETHCFQSCHWISYFGPFILFFMHRSQDSGKDNRQIHLCAIGVLRSPLTIWCVSMSSNFATPSQHF